MCAAVVIEVWRPKSFLFLIVEEYCLGQGRNRCNRTQIETQEGPCEGLACPVRLRSRTICHLQAGGSGKLVPWLQFKPEGLGTQRGWVSGLGSKSWCKGLRAGSTDVQVQGRVHVPVQEQRRNSPFLPLWGLLLFRPLVAWTTPTGIGGS